MAIELQATATGAILYDSSRVSNPTGDIFDFAHWEAQRKIVARAMGRGSAIFVRDLHRYWVLRHYRRGGLVAKLLGDRYLWRNAEHTRAFREWRLLHALHAQGLPVPAPVATRYQRDGLFYRADLLTEALPATRTLADCITGATLSESAWRGVGAVIARLHAAGVHHADLNAHNILLGEQGQAYLLDFDRGRVEPRGAWERDVLARLKRSLLKIQRQRASVNFNESNWQALLGGVQA